MNALPLALFRPAVKYVRPLVWTATVALAGLLLSVSWMRWMDPQIDFGREVYTAWRVLAGDLLARDLNRLYGPLSDYVNAALFACFGTSIRTLVYANLVIYAGIVWLLHSLLRRAYGFFPATAATLAGVAIFGFGHYVGIGNYNYAAPYSHAATHGILQLLVLIVWLARDPAGRSRWHGWLDGLMFGLICLNKTEFVLTGGLLLTAQGARLAYVKGWSQAGKWAGRAIAACAALLVLVWALFCLALGPADAARAAWMALLVLGQSGAVSNVFQAHAMGTDDLPGNLKNMGLALAETLAALGGVIAAGRSLVWLAPEKLQSWILPVMLTAGAVAGFYVPASAWLEAGRAFPGLLLVALGWLAWEGHRRRTPEKYLSRRWWLGVLLVLAAAGMLARMAFNPRLYHYGFFQAMLAGVVALAFILRAAPALAGPRRLAQLGVFGFLLAAFTVGATQLVGLSGNWYARIQQSVGEGGDQFYVFNPNLNPTGLAMWQTTDFLRKQFPKDTTVLVLPEGVMINYWLRRKTPLHVTDPIPPVYAVEGPRALERLIKNPPAEVVLLSRDTREFGVPSFGYDAASGKPMLDWIQAHYTKVGSMGGSPLDPGQFGVWIYKLNP